MFDSFCVWFKDLNMSSAIEGSPLLRFLKENSVPATPPKDLWEELEASGRRRKIPREARRIGGSEKPLSLQDLGTPFVDSHACVIL